MLNIKIAQYVIEQFMSMDDGHLGLLAERLRSTFSVLPKKHTVRGVRRRPEEVTIWISSYIHANPDGSASGHFGHFVIKAIVLKRSGFERCTVQFC